MDRAEKIQEVIENIGRLQRAVSPIDWQKSGLSRAQVSMLYMLCYHRGASMKDLASHLEVTKSAITQILEPLIVKGLVKREANPKDRRTAVLSLSPAGLKTVKKFNLQKMIGLRSALDTLDDKELQTLAKLHQKMTNNINK
jgi:DNA-binding MarR family transcriptional regulator